ncbi:MAG: cupredoxin domain-containing protein [Blastocatellia bacterium]
MNIRTAKLIAFALVVAAAAIRLPERVMLMATSAQAENQITITNNKFEPPAITVVEGTTVTWINKDGVHTVTADDGAFASKALNAGDNFSHQFAKAGKYPFHCTFHGGKGGRNMSGMVIVKKK